MLTNETLKENSQLIDLTKLPSAFSLELTRWNKNAGDHSQIELYKANAKQRDITSASRYIGGYVPQADRSSRFARRASQMERIASEREKEYAGAVIEIDGSFAYLVSWDSYTDEGGNYSLYKADGKYETVSRWSHRQFGSNKHQNRNLTATEISRFIDFDKEVNVYLVRNDAHRVELRAQRIESRDIGDKNIPSKRKALVKFMAKKSEGANIKLQESLLEEVSELQNKISDMFKNASRGDYVDDGKGIDQILKDINSKYREASSIAYNLNDVVNEGTIFENYGNGKTGSYNRYMAHMDSLNKDKES